MHTVTVLLGVSAGVVKLAPDVVVSSETAAASSYPQVFETWDSPTESSVRDTDAVAVPMGKDSTDVISDSREEMINSQPGGADDAVAIATDKDAADDNEEVVETWDSEDEEDMMNKNSREKKLVTFQPRFAE